MLRRPMGAIGEQDQTGFQQGHVFLFRQTEKFAAKREQISKALKASAQRSFGKALDIRVVDQILDNKYRQPQYGAFAQDRGGPAKYFAVVSLTDEYGRGRPVSEIRHTLDHEGIHYLKATGALDADWAMLSGKAQSDWIGRYTIDSRYREASQDLKIEEAIAEAYADWRRGRLEAGTAETIFRKIQAFFNRLVRALRQQGIRSWQDVFQDIEAGKRRAGIMPSKADNTRFAAAWHGDAQFQAAGDPIAAELTSTEIAATDADYNTLQASAFGYLMNLVNQKKTVYSPALGRRVGFSGKGARKAINGKGERLLRLMPAAPDMLANGSLVSTEPSRNNTGIKNVHRISSAASLNGNRIETILVVRENQDGDLFYSLHEDRDYGGGDQDFRQSGTLNPEGPARRIGKHPTSKNQDNADGTKFQARPKPPTDSEAIVFRK